MANLERIYTIPLGDAYLRVRQQRAKRAVAFVRAFALRHMKALAVKISEGVNSLVFRDGMGKPPRRIKVRIVKDDEGLAKVWLIGEEEKQKQIAEQKKKEDEARKKEAEKKAEEKKKEGEKKEQQKTGEAKKEAAKQPAPPAQVNAPGPSGTSSPAPAPKPAAAPSGASAQQAKPPQTPAKS